MKRNSVIYRTSYQVNIYPQSEQSWTQSQTMIWRITIYIVLLVLTIEAKKYPQKWEEQEQWQEFEEFLKWKKMREQHEHRPHETKYEKRPHESYDANKIYESNEPLSNVNPPPIDKAALMARFIVNQAGKKSASTYGKHY